MLRLSSFEARSAVSARRVCPFDQTARLASRRRAGAGPDGVVDMDDPQGRISPVKHRRPGPIIDAWRARAPARPRFHVRGR
jgi:hypothetical protein